VPARELDNIAALQHVGEPPDSLEIEKLFGAGVEWPDTVDDSLLYFNDPEVRALGVPGGGAVAWMPIPCALLRRGQQPRRRLCRADHLAALLKVPNNILGEPLHDPFFLIQRRVLLAQRVLKGWRHGTLQPIIRQALE
jgi:hypothetical protein